MRRTPTQLASHVDIAITRGHAWLWNSYIPEPRGGSGAGWPQFPGSTELTVWGGTLDGLRAQNLERRGGPMNERLRDALTWVRKQQLECGGFDSCEVEYPAAETTAWALIAFGEIGLEATDATVGGAITYLLECVAPGGGVTTTPNDLQDQRIMPMALAVWAFAKYREELRRRGKEGVIDSIVQRLRLVQDRESQAWGVSHGAVPNVATTAQVIHALCEAGVPARDDVIQGANKFVIGRQDSNGSWPNSYDEWFTIRSPRRPHRCLNYSSWWALLALMHSVTVDSDTRRACRSAVKYLVETQSPEGAWRFEEYEDTRHVWLTGQIVVALHEWRRNWLNHDQRYRMRSIGDGLAGAAGTLRRNAIAIVLGFLVAKEVLPGALHIIASIGHTLGIDRASMSNNLLSTAIWASLTILLASLITHLRNR
ncbi:prenyltransferase/squalene oxidase repeat-containing protein [Actinoplanes sp. CA-051413]|uniref:prenyltransferase/squalene oxidase repeat-containing protein n=1 Tax=Actinoplanes sp. CA-051413 TaxID=3239899 RepID=UPI003D9773DF